MQNVPGGHSALQLALVSDGAAPYRPAGHRSGADVPATQNEPGGHGRMHSASRPTASLNTPAVQLVHSAAPPRLYRPGGHCTAVRVAEPAGHAYPAAHSPLHSGVVRPGSAPNRPPTHSPLQFAVPCANAAPNRPAAQALQVPAPGREYVPAGHTDAVALVDPAGHACPALQGPLHPAVLKPTAVTLNQVPAGQSLHDPAPARLYCLVGHTDAVALVDPAAHAYPAVQFPLQVAVFRPSSVVLNQVPAGQLLHDPAPVRLYRPAGQMDAVALVAPAAHA